MQAMIYTTVYGPMILKFGQVQPQPLTDPALLAALFRDGARGSSNLHSVESEAASGAGQQLNRTQGSAPMFNPERHERLS